MKTVLVKVPIILSFREPNEVNDHIQNLRKWCYANTKFPWCTYHLRGVDNTEGGGDHRLGFVAFRFDNDKEAMKFQLYSGE